MADAQLLNKINTTGDVDVSMILDTLMYCDHLSSDFEGKDINYIVDKLTGDQKGLLNTEQLHAVESVKTYISTDKGKSVGKLVMHSCSDNLSSDYMGAKAAAFYDPDTRTGSGKHADVYVAYRGTGEGRWYDNGDAFAKRYSPYQQDGAQYFDYVCESLNLDESTNLRVTGHSKGGNSAQFAAFASKHAYLVDKCYSFDGEGFSPEAIAYFKELYGEDFYEKQRQKMYSISGDNDYVNPLGIKVIPEDHTVYIKTPTEVTDLPNSHALINEDTGKGNLFNYETGEFYEQTTEQSDLAKAAKKLSEDIMKLPADQRSAVCRSIMSLLEEYMPGQYNILKEGLNGEKMTTKEFLEFLRHVDEIGDVLVFTKEGQDLVNDFLDSLLPEGVHNGINNGIDMIFASQFGVIFGPLVYYFFHGKVDYVQILADFLIVGLTHIAAIVADAIIIVDFCVKCIKNFVKLCKNIFSIKYWEARGYLSSHSLISLNTDDLRNAADRLSAVNNRLDVLDSRLDTLYKQVRWRDLMTLQTADHRVAKSRKLEKCAFYLQYSAGVLDDAERKVLEMLG